ncbi:MAG: hypothetical protein K0V04_11815 [Deltaproteobacteria bacterium]|nr:hypothetical protein [Deltaproteobacteria bacterium]
MQITSALNTITQVSGVNGAAVFGDDGECLAHELDHPYEPVLLQEVLRQLGSTSEAYASVGMTDDVSMVLLSFEGGKLVTRRAGSFEMVAITAQKTNLAVLGVAFNVASLRLQRGGSPMPTPPAMRPPAGPGGPVAAPRLGSDPLGHRGQPAVHHLPAAPEHDSWSGRDPLVEVSGVSSISTISTVTDGPSMNWSASGSRTGAGVGLQVMKHLLIVSLRHFGDSGRSVLEHELRRMNATPQSLTSAGFADIILRVARRLPAEHRQQFTADALGDA